jgi:hypothetical protein
MGLKKSIAFVYCQPSLRHGTLRWISTTTQQTFFGRERLQGRKMLYNGIKSTHCLSDPQGRRTVRVEAKGSCTPFARVPLRETRAGPKAPAPLSPVSPCGRHGRDPKAPAPLSPVSPAPLSPVSPCGRHGRDPKIKIKHPDVFSDHVNYPGIFLANIVKQNIHLGAKF